MANADQFGVGCLMIRFKVIRFLPVLLLAIVSLNSCSGFKTPCTVNCSAGNANVSFTLVADALPANPSIFSFKVSLASITLTPTTGTAQTFTPATPLVIDLMRLQSDTTFLGTLANVPAGSYTVQVSLDSPVITFLNDTSSPITAGSTSCAVNAVCTATLSATGSPVIASFTFTAVASSNQGIGLDFNLNNAISLSSGTLSVNFSPSAPNPGVFTAFTLPRQNSNLAANQFDLIEDFTGVVTVSGNSVTITSPTRGTLTATATSATNFNPDPGNTLCPTGTTTLAGCVSNNQIASMDAILNSDGTLSIREIEPLASTQRDYAEGIVSTISSPTQFAIVVTDKVQAATNSLIAGLAVGEQLTVNIPSPNPFLVDTKGLQVASSFATTFGFFNNQTNTSAIHLGQTVAVHATAFTPASGNTIASATADTVVLRWSRLIATPSQTQTTSSFNITSLPSYFGLTPGSIFAVQLFSGSQGADGVTNLDGFTAGNLNLTNPVAMRALFLENSGNTANPAFFAAKVRQR